ncbi:hypothetical protein D8Y22_02855 [Salinadaptatus halalkaliphilus]|uniref:Uncharacterized protein n=1 Tax=Salinadaptatus halalkaliphilus TaxID=2419781 RepID=A0A4S3TS88_9EURY|nr:hypothetical protein D8Y22_02855 [Salinadaptatus halalkaliphilus]
MRPQFVVVLCDTLSCLILSDSSRDDADRAFGVVADGDNASRPIGVTSFCPTVSAQETHDEAASRPADTSFAIVSTGCVETI